MATGETERKTMLGLASWIVTAIIALLVAAGVGLLVLWFIRDRVVTDVESQFDRDDITLRGVYGDSGQIIYTSFAWSRKSNDAQDKVSAIVVGGGPQIDIKRLTPRLAREWIGKNVNEERRDNVVVASGLVGNGRNESYYVRCEFIKDRLAAVYVSVADKYGVDASRKRVRVSIGNRGWIELPCNAAESTRILGEPTRVRESRRW